MYADIEDKKSLRRKQSPSPRKRAKRRRPEASENRKRKRVKPNERHQRRASSSSSSGRRDSRRGRAERGRTSRRRRFKSRSRSPVKHSYEFKEVQFSGLSQGTTMAHVYETLRERFGRMQIPKQKAKVKNGECILQLKADDHKKILEQHQDFYIEGTLVKLSDVTKPQVSFNPGDKVKALSKFSTNSRLRRVVEEGTILRIVKVDRDGDLLVKHKTWPKGDWVKRSNFRYLSRIQDIKSQPKKKFDDQQSSPDNDDNLLVGAHIGMRLQDAFNFPNPLEEEYGTLKSEKDKEKAPTPRTFFPPPPKRPKPPSDPDWDSNQAYELGDKVSCSMNGSEFFDGEVTSLAPLEIRAGPYPVGVSGWKEIRKVEQPSQQQQSTEADPSKFPPPPLEVDETTYSLPKTRVDWLSGKRKKMVRDAIDVETAIDVIELDDLDQVVKIQQLGKQMDVDDLPEPDWDEKEEIKKTPLTEDTTKSTKEKTKAAIATSREQPKKELIQNDSREDDPEVSLVIKAIRSRAKSEKGASRIAIYGAMRKLKPSITTDVMRAAIVRAVETEKIVPTQGQFFAVAAATTEAMDSDLSALEDLQKNLKCQALQSEISKVCDKADVDLEEKLKVLKRDKFLLTTELQEIKNLMQTLLDRYPMPPADRVRYQKTQADFEKKSKELDDVNLELKNLGFEDTEDSKVHSKSEGTQPPEEVKEVESSSAEEEEEQSDDEEEEQEMTTLSSLLQIFKDNEAMEEENSSDPAPAETVEEQSDDLWSADEEGPNNPDDFSPIHTNPGDIQDFPRPCWYKHKKKEWRPGFIVGDLEENWLIEIPGKSKAYSFPKKAVRNRSVAGSKENLDQKKSMSPLPPKRLRIPSIASKLDKCCYLFMQCQSIGYCISKQAEKKKQMQRQHPHVVPEYGISPFPDESVMKTPSKTKSPTLQSLADAIEAYKSSASIVSPVDDIARLEQLFAKRNDEKSEENLTEERLRNQNDSVEKKNEFGNLNQNHTVVGN